MAILANEGVRNRYNFCRRPDCAFLRFLDKRTGGWGDGGQFVLVGVRAIGVRVLGVRATRAHVGRVRKGGLSVG